MLEARFRVSDIDLMSTYRRLVPKIKEKLGGSAGRYGFAARLIYRMICDAPEAAEGVMNNILSKLGEEQRSEIICGAVNSYALDITDKLKDALLKSEVGRSVSFDSICSYREGNAIILCAKNIDIDYRALVSSREFHSAVDKTLLEKTGAFGGILSVAASKAAEAAVSAAPEMTESAALKFLSREDVRKKAAEMLENVINEQGIALGISDIAIERSEYDKAIEVSLTLEKRLFSVEYEDVIIGAVTEYLAGITADSSVKE